MPQADSPEDHITRRGLRSQGFQRTAPAEIVREVFRGDAMEATQPFLQSAVVGADVVEVKVRRVWVWFSGIGKTWAAIPARRAKATIAVPPSQQNSLAGVTTPSSAAAIDTRFNFGSTASVVAP